METMQVNHEKRKIFPKPALFPKITTFSTNFAYFLVPNRLNKQNVEQHMPDIHFLCPKSNL